MNILKFLAFSALVAVPLGGMSQVRFEGAAKAVYEETPNTNTGLGKIYVLYDAAGVKMTYTAKDASKPVVWYSYGAQGGGYAEELTNVVRNGAESYINNVEANCGYIIEEGTDRTYLWVVNYADYRLHLNSLSVSPERDCGTTTLLVNGSGNDITYYTINGVPKKLDRGMTLTYNTLEWNDEQKRWDSNPVTENQEVFKDVLVIPASLCNTDYTLTGDKMLQFWGEGLSVTSDFATAHAVDVRSTAVQDVTESSNRKNDASDGSLGGSAPATITFTAYPTDAVAHVEWQMARDSEFENIELRLNDLEHEETFTEAGTYFWRFIGSNESGECEAYGDTYTVSIGESKLDCPNVFSPGASEGVNDEWKVSYKSIVKFECWIFNRWGTQMCHFTDPSQGWDGKYNGKLVPAGVYYYVIQAEGADSRSYKLKGDINILNYRSGGGVINNEANNTTGE